MREVHPPPPSSLPPTSMPTSAPLQRVISQEEVDVQPNINCSSENDKTADASGTEIPTAPKTKLRVDGFLGEWLSPSYFERSGAPPASEELLKEARKVFTAPAEEIKGADLSMPAIVEFSGVDWQSKEIELSSKPIHEKTGLRAMAAAGHAMIKRPRHSTSQEKQNGILPKAATWQVIGYSPPVPTYSLAPRDGIPIGFVAHARDACIAFDNDWDSTKPPLDWGNGGPFGEEWSSMHRRFRNGLQKMMAFYESSSPDTEPEPEEDLVLILVTHQAGANALIRLLTGAPALHDIGTASLTMAVRRPQPLERRVSEQKSCSPVARRGSLDLGIADDFEMKIIASTEHLRGGSNPLGLNSPRLGLSPALASRKAVGADSAEGFSIGDPMTRSYSGHGLGLGRSPSQRSYAAEDIPAIQSGLWRRDSASTDEDTGTWEYARNANTSMWGSSESLGLSLPLRSASQRGMWGGESSIRRDPSPGKRRWTAVDRSP
jgi:hypothetical protein